MDSTAKRLANKPLVSICMLTYNRAHYIGAAIESVLAQTYGNWKLIIIDDGSTDNTSSIVTSYSDERIKYVQYTENTGLFARRKESLTHTNGKYVAILDSDDVWLSPLKLEKQVEFLESHPNYVLVGTFPILIDHNGNKIGENHYNVTDEKIRSSILVRNQFIHSSVLMCKQTLDKTTGYQPTLAEDLELFLQLGEFGKFANISEYMVAYRVHTGGTSGNKLEMLHAIRNIIQKHNKSYPNFIPALLKSYLRLLLGKVGIQ